MVQLRLGNPTEVVLTTAPSNFTFTRGSTTSGKQWQPRDGKLLLPSNSFHAYAETQATAWKGLDEEVVICVAALGHDVGHPGLNNAFLVSTNQSLALVYNDNAVLENYHAYITFRTISATAEVDGGILRGLSASAYRQLRKQVIDLILATDMAQHFPILSSFRARNASQTFSVSSNEEDKWMLAKLLIKTGDIGHSMLAWEQHYMWACRVNEEFYKQVSPPFRA
ncbi:cGMP-inhibited 3',5'-cyclic phosphodiesterase, putative [Eimeria tenella]|uniref:cGMP-inhibited 3',5'-cyclic phosphodiesterase, putative n=1 Tax=Eimeria tenella TaxID=5802 RepID=U6LC63_EIMTE|nr:cGMP-inhibited 3',5'-cyclic phosphodiesterase, putative [Eimeria tenella]CDJ45340.1 cGMP-inhibited 3',5'-cyclic phosphodiesterase, putative [Eimeria tenella]|eukprot:XP_013236086.1 cGMP-inhibited 3',5'-cyclic phosphodiesterase, putative [Eimeria tenella]